MTHLRFKEIFILSWFAILSYDIQAANIGYTVGYAVGKYDNINLASSSVPIETEYSQIIKTGLNIFEDTESILVSFSSNLRYIDYKKNLASDAIRGQLLASTILRIKPGKFQWALNNNFTQSLIDPLNGNAPANRQNVNVFSTGPDYTVRINSRNNLTFKGRAAKYSYETNPNTNRLSSTIQWAYKLNAGTTLSLNNRSQTTKFASNVANPDYRRNDVYLRLDYTKGVNTLAAEYGETELENRVIKDNGRYLLSFTNARTRTSTLQFLYNQVVTNAGNQALRLDPTQNNNAAPVNGVGGTVFINEVLRVKYNKTVSVGSISFSVFANNIEYDNLPTLDSEAEGAVLSGTWLLPRGSSIRANLRRRDTFFKDPATNRENIDKTYSVEYKYGLRRNIDIKFNVTVRERDSSIIASSYDDARYILSIDYRSL